MEYKLSRWDEKNVVFVFNNVDLNRVSLDKLKKLGAPYKSAAQIVELPDSLVVVFNEILTVLRIEGKRLVIGDQGATTVEGSYLPQLSLAAAKTITGKGVEQVAYGINYRFFITIEERESIEKPREFFRDYFLRESRVDSFNDDVKLVGFEPHFYFAGNKSVYDMAFITASEDSEQQDLVQVRANVHYKAKTRPHPQQFKEQFIEQYEFVGQLLRKM